MKRVLILTQPLRGGNYGCILQAYALQVVLKQLGHRPVTDIGEPLTKGALYRRFVLPIRPTTGRALNRLEAHKIETTNAAAFVREHIVTTDIYQMRRQPTARAIAAYDAFVVGSDQVWRPAYSDVEASLLSFVADSNPARRVAYAASFGVDDMREYSASLVTRTKLLAQRFDAISVREETGVALCAHHWNVPSVTMLDPSLLLPATHYDHLTNSVSVDTRSPAVVSYILDHDVFKQSVLDNVGRMLETEVEDLVPRPANSLRAFNQAPERFMRPRVEEWLQGLRTAKFVVTDSYHGMLFSILFNRPFIVVCNPRRGLARFRSIARRFEIEDRLLNLGDAWSPEIVARNIDWGPINKAIAEGRDAGISFLRTNV